MTARRHLAFAVFINGPTAEERVNQGVAAVGRLSPLAICSRTNVRRQRQCKRRHLAGLDICHRRRMLVLSCPERVWPHGFTSESQAGLPRPPPSHPPSPPPRSMYIYKRPSGLRGRPPDGGRHLNAASRLNVCFSEDIYTVSLLSFTKISLATGALGKRRKKNFSDHQKEIKSRQTSVLKLSTQPRLDQFTWRVKRGD